MTSLDEFSIESEGKTAKIGRLADLLERSGISLEDVGKINRVNLWQGMFKNAEGEAEVVDLTGIQLVPSWDEGPAWPVVQPGPVIRLPVSKKTASKASLKRAVIWPDMQIGYFRDARGQLQPIHDEAAIEVALEITRSVNPDKVVWVGDNLDLAEFSRYRLTAPFQQTTQPAIDRATLLAAETRAAAPNADCVWLAGNHEQRLQSYIVDNAAAAFGLRVGNAPESWPLMSIPSLCRLDESGWTYRAGYPGSFEWITPVLKIVHGELVASSGSTAHKYLQRERVSVIYGHIHRREWAEVTRDDYEGPVTVMAMSPGCLCRTDGVVPSTKQGLDFDGRPIKRPENWQQGVAIVHYDEDSGEFWPEQIPIRDGRAFYGGTKYGSFAV